MTVPAATRLDELYTRAADGHVPLGVMLEVNHACHLDCVQCYIGRDPRERPLSADEYRRVLDELAAEGALFLTFTGGEIFLRPDLVELLAAARTRGFAVTCYTSGTLINPAVADALAGLWLDAIEITLYSVRPEVHDGITRVPGSAERTMTGVRLLRERGVTVRVKAPIMTLNDGAHVEVAAFAHALGASHRFDATVAPRRDGDRTPLGYQLAQDRVARLHRDPLFGREDADDRCATSDGVCGAGRWGCDISPSGDVYPCLAFPYGASAGSLRERSFHDIWHGSPLMRQIRGLTAADLRDAAGGCAHGHGECARCLGFLLTLHPGRLLAPPLRRT